MRQPDSDAKPNELPAPVTELCAHLEERGLPSLSHGDGLLADLRPKENDVPHTRSLLVEGSPDRVLAALPRAVVTSEDRVRLTQATAAGPVDLVCSGAMSVETCLLRFGLGPFAIAYRPAKQVFLDPADQLDAFRAGRLDAVERSATHNPFESAPRRYWIAARLIAEFALTPSNELVELARTAFPLVAESLPQAAPARREITRILSSAHAAPALSFLREVGVTGFMTPGADPAHAARIDRLPALDALRWAAWLRGSATARGTVRFRVPHALARRIEQIQAAHPIDRSLDPGRDAGLRKLLGRLSAAEIEGLFSWRRIELADSTQPFEIESVEKKLAALENRIREIQENAVRSGRVRALALDGSAVMKCLGAGPGPHVGRALAHLARHIAAHPEENEPAALEEELLDWARQNTNLLD